MSDANSQGKGNLKSNKTVKKELKGKEQFKNSSIKKESKSEKPKKKEKKNLKPFKYLKHLMLTEKAIDNVTTKNTLVFVVDLKANKSQIKREVESIFEVKVKKVNTLIDRKGRKKAYVSLMPQYKAEDVATQLGMM